MKIDANILAPRMVVGAIVVALIGALCWWLIPREPSFEGRCLSEWMMAVEDNDWDPSRTERAIRAMGSRALGTALDWLVKEDGLMTQQFVRLVERQSFWVPNIRGAAYWHYGAYEVLRILGPEARPAIPKLVALTRTNSRTALRIRAISVLRSMGPAAEEAIPDLLLCLDDAEREVRMGAAMALGGIGRRPDVVVPKLLVCARDTNRFDVPILLAAFCGFTNEPAQIVPLLENHLQQRVAVLAAAGVLGRFGVAADWPLARALTNQDASVRRAAAVVLSRSQRRRAELFSNNAAVSGASPILPIVSLRDRTVFDGGRLVVARALAANMDHPNLELRRYFANLLLDYSDEAVVALPEVLRAMSSDDIEVAFRAWMVFNMMPLDEIEIAPFPGRSSRSR